MNRFLVRLAVGGIALALGLGAMAGIAAACAFFPATSLTVIMGGAFISIAYIVGDHMIVEEEDEFDE